MALRFEAKGGPALGDGKAISTEMALPVDGDLFDSQNYDGLHFLK